MFFNAFIIGPESSVTYPPAIIDVESIYLHFGRQRQTYWYLMGLGILPSSPRVAYFGAVLNWVEGKYLSGSNQMHAGRCNLRLMSSHASICVLVVGVR